MRSFTSIVFVLLFLFSGIVPGVDLGCELKKLPNLFDHYEEHKACNNGSFWQFLVNEYLDADCGSEPHKDDPNHENLPFHGGHQCCQNSVYYASQEYFSIVLIEHFSQTRFAYTRQFLPTGFYDTPFQPPQV